MLPILGKILERILLKRIEEHLNNEDIIMEEQFGFTKGKSSTLQLARIVDIALVNFNLSKVTQFTTLDLEKAYDTVWHEALLFKMMQYHHPIYIIKTVQDFLANRTLIHQETNHSRTTTRKCFIADAVQYFYK